MCTSAALVDEGTVRLDLLPLVSFRLAGLAISLPDVRLFEAGEEKSQVFLDSIRRHAVIAGWRN